MLAGYDGLCTRGAQGGSRNTGPCYPGWCGWGEGGGIDGADMIGQMASWTNGMLVVISFLAGHLHAVAVLVSGAGVRWRSHLFVHYNLASTH